MSLENNVVLGSGLVVSRAGGIFMSFACWNGSSQGKVQNWKQRISKFGNLSARIHIYIRGLIHIDPCTINIKTSVIAKEGFKFVIPES